MAVKHIGYTADNESYDDQNYDNDDIEIDVDVCQCCGRYFDFNIALKIRGLKVEHAAQVCNRCYHN